MTTEPPATPEPTPAAEPATTTAASPLSNMSGEMMVMIAGVVVLGVHLIFGLIADEWYPWSESLIVGSFAVLLPRVRPEPVGSGISTATLMKIVGYLLAVAGLWDFVGDIRFGWGGGAQDVIASLLLAGAAVLAFLGARAIES